MVLPQLEGAELVTNMIGVVEVSSRDGVLMLAGIFSRVLTGIKVR